MRARLIVIAVVTAIVSVTGLIEFARLIRDRPGLSPQAVATVDSLTAGVTQAGWLDMDMPHMEGFQMPAAMMPGMPEDGHARLAVTLTVTNAAATARPLRVTDEFALRTAKDGTNWKPVGGTFGDLPRLAPASSVSGVLFFDLPTDQLTNSAAWLEWSHQRIHSRLQMPLTGQAPQHTHPN